MLTLFQICDVDGSGTVNDGDELAMLLSYLNLEPSGDCADRLNQMLEQSLDSGTGGISFEEFYFKSRLKECLPDWHVWRDCPPSAPPSPPCTAVARCACAPGAVPPASPTSTCSAVGDPHYRTFGGLSHNFYGRGLYEHARFTIAPCGCEVVIQTLLVKLVRRWPANSAIAGTAVRVADTTFEITGGGDVTIRQPGEADVVIAPPPTVASSTQYCNSGGCTLDRLQVSGSWAWRLHLPGGAGNYLVVPYASSVMPQGYYYNVWLTVAQSVLDLGNASGLCTASCHRGFIPQLPSTACNASERRFGVQCYPVPADDTVFNETTLRALEPPNNLPVSTRACLSEHEEQRRADCTPPPSPPLPQPPRSPAASNHSIVAFSCADTMEWGLWYTEESIAARGPSPQLRADCQTWCEATTENDCNARASALTGERVRCGYDGVDQRCVLFAGVTLTKMTNVATHWAASSDCALINEEAMLCDDGANDEGVNVTAVCAMAGIDEKTALARCDLGFDMEVTEMCAYDYCASGADVGFVNGYKDVGAIDANETLYAPKLALPPPPPPPPEIIPPPPRFNCYTKEVWSAEKSEWCCKAGINTDSDWCCKVYHVCPPPPPRDSFPSLDTTASLDSFPSLLRH